MLEPQKRQYWRKLMLDGNPMDLIEIDKIVSADYDIDNQSDRALFHEEIVELRDALQQTEDEYSNALNNA
jgi:hypothetical protein